ncbi:MAG: hypothetical protein U0J83_01765, partial [Bulleidia sp.]|nr:hypothetical protein [Bulleidia sp.]
AEVETMLETEFNLKEYGETLKKEGEKIGEQKKAIETCKRMLEDHLPVETIQKYTALSEEEIQKIQETLQNK